MQDLRPVDFAVLEEERGVEGYAARDLELGCLAVLEADLGLLDCARE